MILWYIIGIWCFSFADAGFPSPSMTGTPSNDSQNFAHGLNMGAIVTNNRQIGWLKKLQESEDYQGRFNAEIYNRADTVGAGQGFALIHQTGLIADVSGFHGDLGATIGVPIAQVATAYDTADQETLILGLFSMKPSNLARQWIPCWSLLRNRFVIMGNSVTHFPVSMAFMTPRLVSLSHSSFMAVSHISQFGSQPRPNGKTVAESRWPVSRNEILTIHVSMNKNAYTCPMLP